MLAPVSETAGCFLAIQQNRAETCPKPIQTFKTIPETLYSLQAETVVFNTRKYYPAREVRRLASSATLLQEITTNLSIFARQNYFRTEEVVDS